MTPRISIKQHEACVYEWAIMYDAHKADDDFGETSILACLMSALSGLPSEESLVELSYQGVHMGTFARQRVQAHPAAFVSLVAATYAELTLN
jgi:hypothetical protein